MAHEEPRDFQLAVRKESSGLPAYQMVLESFGGYMDKKRMGRCCQTVPLGPTVLLKRKAGHPKDGSATSFQKSIAKSQDASAQQLLMEVTCASVKMYWHLLSPNSSQFGGRCWIRTSPKLLALPRDRPVSYRSLGCCCVCICLSISER